MARGDHIFVKRLGGVYAHHGIDLGDGTVIHFSGEPTRMRHAKVVREPLEVFCEGRPHCVVEYGENQRPAEETIETAMSHLGSTGYQLWANNCEHFACYCKHGRKESGQVQRAMRGLVMVGGAALAIGLAAGLALARRPKSSRG